MKVVQQELIEDESSYDVAIIGAGPSGITAALALDICARSQQKICKILLIEEGKEYDARDRWNSIEITCGIGGSGLFSDGKFSFFPSSSQLWTLNNKTFLSESYHQVSEFLRTASQIEHEPHSTNNNNNLGKRDLFDLPPFPTEDEIEELAKESTIGEWTLKRYPSHYMDLQQRKRLISLLQDACQVVECLIGCKVTNVQSNPSNYKLFLESKSCDPKTINAKYLLFCGGRFGPLFLNSSLDIATCFKRLEVGVRIQQDTKNSFFVNTETSQNTSEHSCKINDPKYKFMDITQQIEWRTFCACHDGEVVLSETQGLWTVSGRADCSPTGKSNIGFNTRILDETTALRIWRELEKNLRHSNVLFHVPLEEFLTKNSTSCQTIQRTFGGEVADKIREGLSKLQEKFPSLSLCETTLIGPTLEGVGLYPQLQPRSLRCKNRNDEAGDSSGVCRGIVAGMISGYYAALELWQDLISNS